ncbi:hypothetical protein KC960_04660 [Candidatus Saccharibacteria bacterium]|nr:hypothetical protein [Candidatus Saccharibacteria bacterium]
MAKQKKSKILLITLLVIVALGCILFVLEKTGVTDFYHKNNTTEQSTPTPTINYEPPTNEEKQQADTQKQINENTDKNTQLPNTAEVVIVDANQYDQNIEVRAFVSNVIQDGTCEITFIKGNTEFSKTTSAKADASTTPCLAVTVPRSEFIESGEWTVKVSYENSTITGEAEAKMTLQ